MGVLDKPQDTLARDIWLPDNSLKVSVRHQILDRLKEYISPIFVSRVIILGSITGYKYSPESDVDVNVQLISGLDRSLFHKIFKRKNSEGAVIGAQRPLNFFVDTWRPDAAYQGKEGYPYGVYDLLSGEWLIPVPETRPRHPSDEFHSELVLARLMARKISYALARTSRRAQEVLSSPNIPSEKLLAKARRLEAELEKLHQIHKDLDEDRKFAYDSRWGVPRKSWENILYKHVEYSSIGKILEDLENQDYNIVRES